MANYIDRLAAIRRRRLPPAQRSELQPERWGLALSGGGIRSATFCLGILHSLGRNKVFHRFDLLSTVSGGGYVGAMLGRLFHQAVQVPRTTSADRIEQALADADRRWFTWWLRANGRYLIPHGTKDAFFAAATFGRNLAAVHIELALLSILLGLLFSAIDIGTWQVFDAWSRDGLLGDAHRPSPLVLLTGWPTLWLLLPVLAALGVIVASTYWVYPSDAESRIPGWRWFAAALGAGGCAAIVVAWPWLQTELMIPLGILASVLVVLATLVAAALTAGILLATGVEHARARNRLTAVLGWMLTAGIVIFLAGGLDYFAWLLSRARGARQGQVALAIALAGVVLRALMPRIAELPGNFPPFLRRSLGAVLNLAGLMVLAGLIIFWVSLVHSTVTQQLFPNPGSPPRDLPFHLAWDALFAILVPGAVMFLTSASNIGFLNKSSLYSFYKARLVRGYLGAANGKRFGKGTNATEAVPEVRDNESLVGVDRVHDEDDMSMADYRPHHFGGPVHLINVCANQTRDPRGGLFNQDRKGLAVTVAPPRVRIGVADWEPMAPERSMTLGSWMAISGAAVSPGLGSATRPGVAALAMMAGLRLGYWWERQKSDGVWRQMGKYGLLFSELLGRFDVERKAPSFLSDGGHFENTGTYALLREKCQLIVLADCGADPRYAFGDIENLVRKARIDLQADIRFLKPKARLNRGWEAFGSLSDIASSDSSASLALAEVWYAGAAQRAYLIVVKPTMYAGLPVDLVNFKADNPAFPQEPTTDQFFDEAQWESYFRLGSMLGSNLSAGVLLSVPTVASSCFELDDGATTQDPTAHPVGTAAAAAASSAAAASPTKRLPARIVATGAVTASVSLGAIASLGVTAYQAINTEEKQRHEALQTDPAEVKELTRLYAELLASGQNERSKAAVNLALGLVRVAEQVCGSRKVEGYQSSRNIRMMLEDARKACNESAAREVSVCKQLLQEDTPSSAGCLASAPRPQCVPQYWIRDYGRDPGNCRSDVTPGEPERARDETHVAALAQHSASSPAQPASPPAPAASAAPEPTLPGGAPGARGQKPCAGKTVYIQIYGPERREGARLLREEWRKLGASVPPVEDVVQSARQEQRSAPTPVASPTIIEHRPESHACSLALAHAANTVVDFGSSWTVRELRLASGATQDVIEAWVPPRAAAAAR